MKHYFRAVEVFIHLPKSIESILIFPISVLFLELYGMSAGCGCRERLIGLMRVWDAMELNTTILLYH